MKQAVLDIGSNSVRLMLWADGKTLYKKVLTTRLAAGAEGTLREDAMQRTLEAVSSLALLAAAEGARLSAFATAAVRSSTNGNEFCARVRAACGVDVEVLSGEDEARIGLFGATQGGDGGIIDLGGASTEICTCQGGEIVTSMSLPMGCVKLFEACGEEAALLDRTLDPLLSSLESAVCTQPMYAIGGTASTLASIKLGLTEYDAERLNGLVLPQTWVRKIATRLFSMTVEARKQVAGMDPRRADVIAGGAYFLAKIMEKLSLPEIMFSDRDNLEGYLFLRGQI